MEVVACLGELWSGWVVEYEHVAFAYGVMLMSEKASHPAQNAVNRHGPEGGKTYLVFLWALGLHKWLSISRWPKDLHAALVRPLEFDQNGSMQNETFMLLYFYQH